MHKLLAKKIILLSLLFKIQSSILQDNYFTDFLKIQFLAHYIVKSPVNYFLSPLKGSRLSHVPLSQMYCICPCYQHHWRTIHLSKIKFSLEVLKSKHEPSSLITAHVTG